MKKSLFKDLSILNLNLIKIIKHNDILGTLLVSLFLNFFISSNLKAAEINLAIIDTGFCKIHHHLHKAIIEVSFFDAGTGVPALVCPDDYLKLPRFHGENVLNIFQKNVSEKNNYKLHLITVFDKNGLQNIEFWKSALKYIHEHKIDFVISAVGLPTKDTTNTDLSGIWFMSAPRVGPGIKKTDIVFPQNNFLLENVFLVGTYFKNNMRDSELLYEKHIALYALDLKDTENPHFFGTSRAVGLIASKILNICSMTQINEFKKCVNLSKKLVFEDIYSFE